MSCWVLTMNWWGVYPWIKPIKNRGFDMVRPWIIRVYVESPKVLHLRCQKTCVILGLVWWIRILFNVGHHQDLLITPVIIIIIMTSRVIVLVIIIMVTFWEMVFAKYAMITGLDTQGMFQLLRVLFLQVPAPLFPQVVRSAENCILPSNHHVFLQVRPSKELNKHWNWLKKIHQNSTSHIFDHFWLLQVMWVKQ